jgi:hypothetical protein
MRGSWLSAPGRRRRRPAPRSSVLIAGIVAGCWATTGTGRAAEFVAEPEVAVEQAILGDLEALSMTFTELQREGDRGEAMPKLCAGLENLRRQRAAGTNVAAACTMFMAGVIEDVRAKRLSQQDAELRHMLVSSFVICAAYGTPPVPSDLKYARDFEFDVPAIAGDVFPLLHTGDPEAQRVLGYILKRFTCGDAGVYDFSMFAPHLSRPRSEPPLFLMREIFRRNTRQTPHPLDAMWPLPKADLDVLADLEGLLKPAPQRTTPEERKVVWEKMASLAGRLMTSRVWWARALAIEWLGFHSPRGVPQQTSLSFKAERHPVVLERIAVLGLDRQRGARAPQRPVDIFVPDSDPKAAAAPHLAAGSSPNAVYTSLGPPARATPLEDPTCWEYRGYRWDDGSRRRVHVASLFVDFGPDGVVSWEVAQRGADR